ncbi:hypothetical protein [Fluviicola taffensis]|uniref:Uncharacterized protein n=1 Tax=Fluviicola taffensis (strain DSM 16823 / NCIMB 13979 / RW262) TaxID=755732 RepID=F2IH63_FLUTR|nr:hypothetical protein [Fluviicola taffensis]AEA45877.1 hypothetical protein Fluta_3913 [Fluviicola taffensis DSM 16823]
MEDLLDQIPSKSNNTIQFRWWVILIWVSVFMTGYFFKFMHWPGNSIVRVIGTGGFMAYSLSFLILAKPRTTPIIVCNSISLLWTLILIWGALFNGGYPFNLQGITIQGILFVICFLIHLGVLYLMKKVRAKKN